MATATTPRPSKNLPPDAKRRDAKQSSLEKWEIGIDRADADWDIYDCQIQSVVDEYNRHLSNSQGYVPLDWKVIKSMLWVETGAGSFEWKSKPMQIGNRNDPGLASLLLGNEGGDLIIPPSMRPYMSIEGVKAQPLQNIRAGVGYLLMRMANYAFKSVADADAGIYEITAKQGDNLDRIAKAQGSTADVMKKLNPSSHIVRAGDVLKYQKASIKRVITGWSALSAGGIAQRYNHGDPAYAKKLQYAAQALSRRGDVACAR
ncbi:LysM peptidoglycan-binding domain-containing protein [Variovorax sp. GB1P17]|uniref:LysM peptidoglycan-binding domain-containing protein n=1 Tax=Variovorax sp. GB1P17 TaxID=3443740 RepID=UPI003F4672C9